MEICFEIEVHIYAEERLCDEFLEDGASCGILGPEVVLPLRRNRNCILSYQYVEETATTGDAIHAIIHRVEGDNEENYAVTDDCVRFLYGSERYLVANKMLNLHGLIEKYLDPEESGKVRVQILVCADAGTVCCEDGIRYYMHSRKAGKHNEPHVHVRDTGHKYSASLALSDGRVLVGKFPGKLLKKAQKKLAQEQEYFYQCWQAMTDGLVPDINYRLGLIQY